MRRTRGFAWYHILFAVPAVALAFGVQYFVRKNYPEPQNPEVALVTKPSFYKADAGSPAAARETATNPTPVQGLEIPKPVAKVGFFSGLLKRFEKSPDAAGPSRTIAEAKKTGDWEIAERKEAPIPAKMTRAARTKEAEEPEAHENYPATQAEAAPALHHLKSGPVAASEGMNTENAAGAKNSCMSLEYRGEGPNATISAQDWDKVLVQFTAVKNDLMVWLSKNRKGFPDKVAEFMEKQIMAVRIKKPPVTEEPDLAWRGIGVYGTEGKGAPVIRLSSGFVKLVTKQPQRAKFELARLVAQSWAPCEIKRTEPGEAWEPLLACLQVTDTQACGAGSVSEAGWAVSSALAATLAPPGCTVPAFRAPEMAKCLKIPTPVPVRTAGFESLWKETRR